MHTTTKPGTPPGLWLSMSAHGMRASVESSAGGGHTALGERGGETALLWWWKQTMESAKRHAESLIHFRNQHNNYETVDVCGCVRSGYGTVRSRVHTVTWRGCRCPVVRRTTREKRMAKAQRTFSRV